MATGEQLVEWCESQIGIGYSWDGRFGPFAYDCSGLMVASLRANDVWVGGFNSTGQETWCKNEGLGIDVAAAEFIVGAPVFIWGYGANGHVGMSMGDGRVIETPSNSHGGAVGISPFWQGRTHNGWTGAGLWPGVDYGFAPAGDPLLQPGSQGDVVKDWQRFLGVTPDGQYGNETAEKVRAYQALMGIPVTGVIDQATWDIRRLIESTPAPILTQPTSKFKEDEMHLFHVLGDGVDYWVLWDGFNWTDNPDNVYELVAKESIAHSDITPAALQSLRVYVGKNVEAFMDRIVAKIKA
jgi:peptidoglycan hydrolase-like protein with peptidoglycan-binding domain